MSDTEIYRIFPDVHIICEILDKSRTEFEEREQKGTPRNPPSKHAVIAKWLVNGSFEDTIFEPTNNPAELLKQVEHCISREVPQAKLLLFEGSGRKDAQPSKTLTLIVKKQAQTTTPPTPVSGLAGFGNLDNFDKQPISSDPAIVSLQFMMIRQKADAEVDKAKAILAEKERAFAAETERLNNRIAELEAELIDADGEINGLNQGITADGDKWGKFFGSILSNGLEGFVVNNPKLLKAIGVDEATVADVFGGKIQPIQLAAPTAAATAPPAASFSAANEDDLFEGVEPHQAEATREFVKLMNQMNWEEFKALMGLIYLVSDGGDKPTMLVLEKIKMGAFLLIEYAKGSGRTPAAAPAATNTAPAAAIEEEETTFS